MDLFSAFDNHGSNQIARHLKASKAATKSEKLLKLIEAQGSRCGGFAAGGLRCCVGMALLKQG